MNYSAIQPKYVAVFVVACLLSSCATHYDKVGPEIRSGMSIPELEATLKNTNTAFSYRSCEEWSKTLSEPKITCVNEQSVGLYLALVNDGSYFLGMGSTDVQYQIEISSNAVTEVRKENVYTFL